jgi:hypothetical protein
VGSRDIYFHEMTIDQIGAFVRENLVVFVAVVLLPLKWIVVRVLKDPEAEAIALMSVPEDICYVALGLVMGDIVNSTGAFQKHFAGSSNASIDKGLTVGINLAVAIVVHRLSQWCTGYFKQWRAAERARTAGSDPKHSDPRQGTLEIPNSDENMMRLMVRYLFYFSIGYAVQLTIVLMWLHWVAKVVSGA